MTSEWGVTAVLLVTVGLVILVALRPQLTHRRGGKILAFLGLFIFPVLAAGLGAGHHFERAKTTEFCLSCHEMEPYGESLWVDDTDYLPASHFQNQLIPRELACYSCHTDYTMFGGVQAKLRGLRHVWVHYLGSAPEKLELYEPYQNRECLHCHGSARAFEESELHADVRAELSSGETSCLECHEWIHGVEELAELERWEGAGEP